MIVWSPSFTDKKLVGSFNYSSRCGEELRGDVGVRRLETAANTRLGSEVLTHILLFMGGGGGGASNTDKAVLDNSS